MAKQVPPQFIPLIKDVVHQLVIGNYAGLIADGHADNWTEETLHDITAEIIERQGALVDLPDEAFDRGISSSLQLNDGGWGVDMSLWTIKGTSEWTIVLDIDNEIGGIVVHIEDIEVK